MTAGMVDMVGQLLCLQEPNGRSPPGGKGWDARLFECVVEKTQDVDLRVLPGLYNPEGVDEDMSLYGSYKVFSSQTGYGSGVQPLALHHYRDYHRLEAGKGHIVASLCGEDCFLQRFLFKDGWVLVNGYTLTQYLQGARAVPLARKKHGNSKLVALGERLVIDKGDIAGQDEKTVAWKGHKKTWRLFDSVARENGEVWQAYINRKGGDNSVSGDISERLPGNVVHGSDEEKADVDSVVIIIWEPAS
ncbi:hypothetical protein B0H67DRAFT_579839 [Lasiosphaeris hirsuta]|uniref:Uncharacterized protein n=1 Tax=Lasiosphaeris hirsuta TaxID=260670 RepID=A0AA40DTL6_9PEZI|nr:hypothetical protein B0H67DRAFT_579839 [Lasiosphaeris hirsuta]